MVDIDAVVEPMQFPLFEPKPCQLVQSTLSLVSRSTRRLAPATVKAAPRVRHYAVEIAVTETSDVIVVVCLERYTSAATLQAQVGWYYAMLHQCSLGLVVC
jgi:hypothetical protein